MTGDAHKAALEAAAQALYEADPDSGYDADDPRTFWRSPDSYWSVSVWDQWIGYAAASNSAYLTTMQEKGWRLVPREATGEMRVRMKAHFYQGDKWQAAYDAAPDWREGS